MPDTPDVPDLRTLLREASRPSASVTVPLKQGLAAAIHKAEDELRDLAEQGATPRRAGSGSPIKAKAQEVEALRAEMAGSAVTFHFEALTQPERDQIRQDMAGRDDADEVDLRATAAMCRKAVTADGTEYPGGLEWTDFRDLRDALGVAVYSATIDDAATRASGAGGWSVPFSSAASLIRGTEK